MELNFLQILLLTIWSGLGILDSLSFNFGVNGIIQTGIFTGLILGKPDVGLLVGGTLQLLALGIGTFGGASIPNYTTAAMVVTAFSTDFSQAETLIASLGIPIATLTIQFDILGRMANTFFQQRADKYVALGDFKMIERMNWLGTLPWFLSRAIPVLLALWAGPSVVSALMTASPTWLVSGFKIAGKMLPAVGFAILLKYLPAQRNFQYVILGFVLAAYLALPTLAVSLIGLAIAMTVFQRRVQQSELTHLTAEVDGGDEYDE